MRKSADAAARMAVHVVVPPRVLLLDIAGPVEVLRKTNLETRAVRFDLEYVGPRAEVRSSIGLTIAGIAPLPNRVGQGDLILVAGSADSPLGGSESTREQDGVHEDLIVEWLRRVVRPGVMLASICSGALLAARAGLMNGYECTTHHACTDELARLAPTARVKDNRLFVEDGERLSSAGITSGVDMMLHFVSQLAGHAVALAVARYLVVYMRRGPGDSQLSPWLEGRNHIHPAIHRAQDAIAAHPTRGWSVEQLASVAATSPRHLSRLFNEHAGMSVVDYVSRMRLALAREMLNNSRLDMEAVAERAGFGSARQLRRTWSRFHELPPSHSRRDLSHNG